MRSLGENINEQRAVEKNLVSTRKYKLHSYCGRVIKNLATLLVAKTTWFLSRKYKKFFFSIYFDIKTTNKYLKKSIYQAKIQNGYKIQNQI
jgi:hypothetical protein